MPEDMGAFSKKIEELKEKIARNPSSRLFLQLAEEYRRSGNPEEAIAVLEEGLKHHPNYTAAKVCLAKALIDLNRLSEAKDILEEVVRVVPENLVANRALADIYYIQGNTEAALSRYELIQMYNPADKEITERIEEIKKSLLSVPGEIPQEPEEVEGGSIEVSEPPSTEVIKEEVEIASPPVEEVSKEEAPPADRGVSPEIASSSEAPLEKEVEPSSAEPIPPPDTDLSELKEVNETPSSEEMVPEVELDLTNIEGELPELETKLEINAPPSEKKSTPPPPAEAEVKVEGSVSQEEEFLTPTMAELYERQGMFDKALEIYSRLLNKYPNSAELRDRIARVKARMEGKIGERTIEEKIPPKPPVTSVEEKAKAASPPKMEGLPADVRKKEKIDTLNKWLETIKKMRG